MKKQTRRAKQFPVFVVYDDTVWHQAIEFESLAINQLQQDVLHRMSKIEREDVGAEFCDIIQDEIERNEEFARLLRMYLDMAITNVGNGTAHRK